MSWGKEGWGVVYVAGASRTGSTLLGMLLGRLPGVVWVGELWHIWERGVVENRLCGCGERFLECPFWDQVGEVAFGGWHAVDAPAQAARRYAVARQRHIPILASGVQSRRFRAEAEAYVQLQRRVYEAVVAVSSDRIVVDSSKSAAYGLLLRRGGVDVRVVHLIRDSRAVAYSWARQQEMADGHDDEHMPTFGSLWSAAIWIGDNLAAEVMSVKRLRVRRVRYESLASSPMHELGRTIADVMPNTTRGLPIAGDQAIPIGIHHSVAGNPLRMRRGDIRLRVDDEWRSRLPAADKRTVTLLTSPLLVRYGYPLRLREPVDA